MSKKITDKELDAVFDASYEQLVDEMTGICKQLEFENALLKERKDIAIAHLDNAKKILIAYKQSKTPIPSLITNGIDCISTAIKVLSKNIDYDPLDCL
jgi:hypothetical protein